MLDDNFLRYGHTRGPDPQSRIARIALQIATMVRALQSRALSLDATNPALADEIRRGAERLHALQIEFSHLQQGEAQTWAQDFKAVLIEVVHAVS